MRFDPGMDPTVAATMSSIGQAAEALMDSVGVATDPTSYRIADLRLEYLKALIPVDHAARAALLEVEDKLTAYRRQGYAPHAAYEDLMVLLGRVMTEVAAKPIEAYTIGDHRDLVEKLPVGNWLETEYSVRMVGGMDGRDRARHIDAVHAGHRAPTLVIEDDGMPIAQIGVGILLEIATNSGGGRFSDPDQEEDLGQCSYGPCDKPALYLVGPDRSVAMKGQGEVLAACADDLPHAVTTTCGAYGTRLVEVLSLPPAAIEGTIES